MITYTKYKKIANRKLKEYIKYIPYILCILFFVVFSTLTVVNHQHFGTFGFDLGINDQTVWRYSQFQPPLTTIDPFPDKTKLAAHVELVYLFISPAYYIWNSATTLLLLEVVFIASSGMAIYLLARKRKLSLLLSNVLVITYLGFYGIQNALWFDVHSITFGAAFIAWFLYFFDSKKYKYSLLFLILAITSKENVAFITFLISSYYLIKSDNKKWPLTFMSISALYILFVFFIFFPYIVNVEYLYQNSGGLFSNINPISLIDTQEKLKTIFYSFFSYGFLPLLSPLTLIPIIGDFAVYFVIGSELPGAQGLFGQYRVMLSPLLAWSTIITISRFKRLNTPLVALFLLATTALMQYHLHLPASYLSKGWFWSKPLAANNITLLVENNLDDEASVVSQNNITPRISHRDKIYTLYPEMKNFSDTSICGSNKCNWFHWYNEPEYLIVDLSPNWDARHLLTNNEDFKKGIVNLEKAGVISIHAKQGDAILYKINSNPKDF